MKVIGKKSIDEMCKYKISNKVCFSSRHGLKGKN